MKLTTQTFPTVLVSSKGCHACCVTRYQCSDASVCRDNWRSGCHSGDTSSWGTPSPGRTSISSSSAAPGTSWTQRFLQILIPRKFSTYYIAQILRDFPMLNYLVARVGAIPNIKKWMETRPPNGAPQKDFMIFFKNAHRILAENPMSCL